MSQPTTDDRPQTTYSGAAPLTVAEARWRLEWWKIRLRAEQDPAKRRSLGRLAREARAALKLAMTPVR
jgi:hypothetical protein